MTFQIFDNPPRIKCEQCDRISYNPNDVEQKYCGYCHKFHTDVAWQEWYGKQLEAIADYLEQQDPQGFQRLVEEVKQWKEGELQSD